MLQRIADLLYRLAEALHQRDRADEMPIVGAAKSPDFGVLVRRRHDGGLTVDLELFVPELGRWITTGHVPGEQVRIAAELLDDTATCLNDLMASRKG